MEFEVNGREFKSKQLNAFKQFHVARRLTPILSSLKDAFAVAGGDMPPTELEMMELIFEPLSKAVASMTDEDADYVLNACLDATQIKHAGAWSNIRRGDQIMFQFIDMAMLMQIAFYVLQENFASFFPVQPETTTAANPA